MQLIEAFVHNPVKVAVAVLLVVLFGAIALFRMPRTTTDYPDRFDLAIVRVGMGHARSRWSRSSTSTKLADHPGPPYSSPYEG